LKKVSLVSSQETFPCF